MQKKLHQYKTLWLLLLVAVYAVLGFFFAPKIIQQQITSQLSQQLAMQAEMSALRFNPLTFTVKIDDLTLTDAKQQTWYQSQLTGINFDPLNLIWGEWNFSDLDLVQPKITVVVDEAGQIVVPALPEFSKPTEGSEPINLSVNQVRLSQAQMNIKAANVNQDFSLNLNSITLQLEHFSLADEDNHFEIELSTDQDELVALNGDYNHQQQTLKTKIQLTDWQANTMNQFLPKDFNLKTQAGLIQATGQVDWQLSQKPVVNFSIIEIQDLQGDWLNEVTVKQLQARIEQVAVNTETQTVDIERFESSQADWQINWPMNVLSKSLPSTTSPENKGDYEVLDTPTPAWQVTVNRIHIQNWPVKLIDRSIKANLPFTIKSLELDQANNLKQSMSLVSEVLFDTEGQVNISSQQVLSPLAVSADIKLKNLSLIGFTPWISELSGLEVTEGYLTADQKLKLYDGSFDVTGNAVIKNATIVNQNAQFMASWDKLAIDAITLSSQAKSVVLDQITLDQANGNLILDAEKNIQIETSEVAEPSTDNLQHKNDDAWVIKIGAIGNQIKKL